MNRTKLSPFQGSSPCCPQDQCYYVVLDPSNTHQMLCLSEISRLFSYLLGHHFKIDTALTELMVHSEVRIPNLICFISGN